MNNPTSDFQYNKMRLQDLEVEMQDREVTATRWQQRGLVTFVALMGIGLMMLLWVV